VNAIAINTMHNEKRRSDATRRWTKPEHITRPPPPVAAKIDLDKMADAVLLVGPFTDPASLHGGL